MTGGAIEGEAPLGGGRKFWAGFAVAGLLLLAVAGGLQALLTEAGELNIQNVVRRQLAAQGERLFSSGLHQQALPYKIALTDAVEPDVVAIGSSRAMQFRSAFFTSSFVNLGGSVNNVADLELVATKLGGVKKRPKLAVFVPDPWWFNPRYSASGAPAGSADYPRILSADMVFRAAKLLRRGDWSAMGSTSDNLGIFSRLRDEGYARDGSFHYLATLTGEAPSADYRFADTFQRIANDTQRFERGDRPDAALIGRACAALRSIAQSADHMVMIAPPFAGPVTAKMAEGGYAYAAAAFRALQACVPTVRLYDFSDLRSLPGASDCEFVDGVHGGDVVYARMLSRVAASDANVRRYADPALLDRFIEAHKGSAGGVTLDQNPDKLEVDFLGLGCVRRHGTK